MIRFRQKRPRLRLDAESYRRLRQQVLARDGWRCQRCGEIKPLTCHHKNYRSHGRRDDVEGMEALCSDCHTAAHKEKRGLAKVRE